MPEIVSKNPVNDPTGKKVNTHSTFRPNYSMYQGAVFGLNTPVYAAGTTDGDKFSVRIAQDIDTARKEISDKSLKRGIETTKVNNGVNFRGVNIITKERRSQKALSINGKNGTKRNKEVINVLAKRSH